MNQARIVTGRSAMLLTSHATRLQRPAGSVLVRNHSRATLQFRQSAQSPFGALSFSVRTYVSSSTPSGLTHSGENAGTSSTSAGRPSLRSYTTQELEAMTLPELRSLLRDHGLKVSGRKKDLVSRVSRHIHPENQRLTEVGTIKNSSGLPVTAIPSISGTAASNTITKVPGTATFAQDKRLRDHEIQEHRVTEQSEKEIKALEGQQIEQQRQLQEQKEQERLLQQQELDRLAKEQQETARRLQEQQEKERQLQKQQEKERQLKERQERERRLEEQQEKERQLKEQQEKERRLKEQQEKERQLKEQQEKERQLKAQQEKERQLKEQQERERQLKEQQEKERQLKEQQEKERQLKEQQEKERQLKEQQEKERQLKEQQEKKRQLKEQQEKERQLKEQQEQERQLKERQEKERQLKEQQEKDRQQKEQQEKDRQLKGQQETARQLKEQQEKERQLHTVRSEPLTTIDNRDDASAEEKTQGAGGGHAGGDQWAKEKIPLGTKAAATTLGVGVVAWFLSGKRDRKAKAQGTVITAHQGEATGGDELSA
ncbi:hypothetical protein BGZ98_007409 [Dissophora globulifera]|nr:hypothetical protein BGZ98_007409 [Dissophora globulifera]